MKIVRTANPPITTNSAGDMRPDELRTVGMVAGVHGLQGTLRIAPLSDFPERFEALGTVYLMRDNQILAVHQVKRVKWLKELVLVSLRDVTRREQAEELRGAELCVPDSETWELPENVFYIDDLIGSLVLAEDNSVVGTLSSVIEGSQDTLVVTTPKGELLIPFVSEWVGEVNIESRTIHVLNWRRLSEADEIPPSPDSDDH